MALNFLAPLTSIIEDIGIPIGFLTWVSGPQQSKKTSLVSAINSHFGNFDKNHSPLSFLDGIPSLISKSAQLNNVVVLCDDYFPSANKQEATQMKKLAEELISLSYDRMTRSRSKSNGKMRKNHRQKSMIIATGESFPELSQSRLSRVLIINMNKNDVNTNELTEIQTHKEELQYSMKEYIKYSFSNIDEIKTNIKQIFNSQIKQTNQGISYRTSEIITSLYIGYSMLIEFCTITGVIEEKEKNERLKECWNVLLEIGKEQNEEVENISPVSMVISAMEVLASTRKIFVVDIDSAPYLKKEHIYKTEFIGFYDKERNINCVYPDLLYKQIRSFYNQQGVDFPFNKATICKELMTSGNLYKTEKQERPQIRIINPITKKEESTIGILADKIYIPCRYNESGETKER